MGVAQNVVNTARLHNLQETHSVHVASCSHAQKHEQMAMVKVGTVWFIFLRDHDIIG